MTLKKSSRAGLLALALGVLLGLFLSVASFDATYAQAPAPAAATAAAPAAAPTPPPACDACGDGVSKPSARVEPGTADFCQNCSTRCDAKHPPDPRNDPNQASATAATSWTVPNRPACPLTPPMA